MPIGKATMRKHSTKSIIAPQEAILIHYEKDPVAPLTKNIPMDKIGNIDFRIDFQYIIPESNFIKIGCNSVAKMAKL